VSMTIGVTAVCYLSWVGVETLTFSQLLLVATRKSTRRVNPLLVQSPTGH